MYVFNVFNRLTELPPEFQDKFDHPVRAICKFKALSVGAAVRRKRPSVLCSVDGRLAIVHSLYINRHGLSLFIPVSIPPIPSSTHPCQHSCPR